MNRELLKSNIPPVPHTDEEVIHNFETQYDDPFLSDAFKGLYRCHRKMGMTVFKAYELTLRTFLGM